MGSGCYKPYSDIAGREWHDALIRKLEKMADLGNTRMPNNTIEEFKKIHKISRAIYWDTKCGKFLARSYSATVIAENTNEDLLSFKLSKI